MTEYILCYSALDRKCWPIT